MKVGYANVSNFDQEMSIQLDALKHAGCKQIFTDLSDGIIKDRPGLETVLNHMREGDVLVVWRLARLGRSLKQIIDSVNLLGQQGVGIQSLQESLDTTASDGHLLFQLFAILAKTERDLIRERTQIGLRAARARGRKGGRPKGLSEKAKRTAVMAERLYQGREMTIAEICEELSISKTTLYNYLRYQNVKIGAPAIGRGIK